jgi:hypothetical protein
LAALAAGLSIVGTTPIGQQASAPTRLQIGNERARERRAPLRGKMLATLGEIDYFLHCPISHVPVAVCRSVGIRTRGRTAA